MSEFYVPGGTMKPGAPSYIERRADAELYQAVLAREYCTVLTTRQMGKSSLMARTAARLREQAVACATVDLQGKGDKTTPPEQWYYGVAKQIADGLELPSEWTTWWKEQQMLPPAQRRGPLSRPRAEAHRRPRGGVCRRSGLDHRPAVLR